MKQILMASLVVAAAVISGGCYEFQTFVHSPFGPGTLCDPTHCGDCGPCGGGCGLHGGRRGFGPTWGCGPAASCEPSCAPGAGCGDACGIAEGCGSSCGPACGDCGPACGPCGEPGCGGCCSCGCGCGGPGPIRCVLGLLHPAQWFGCYNNGCGEVYWGDFHGDPPDGCDPCNRMGDYTGCTGGGCANCGGQPVTSSVGIPSSDVLPPSADPDDLGRPAPTKAPERVSKKPTKTASYSGRSKNPYSTRNPRYTNQAKNPYYSNQPQKQYYPNQPYRGQGQY